MAKAPPGRNDVRFPGHALGTALVGAQVKIQVFIILYVVK